MTRDDARATLLRALDKLDDAAGELASSDVVHLCVVYSAGGVLPDNAGYEEIGGHVNTSGPAWLHAALLRRVADHLEQADEDDD